MTKREARRQLTARAKDDADTLWLRADWLKALGDDEVNAILVRHGYTERRSWGRLNDPEFLTGIRESGGDDDDA